MNLPEVLIAIKVIDEVTDLLAAQMKAQRDTMSPEMWDEAAKRGGYVIMTSQLLQTIAADLENDGMASLNSISSN